jgi:hypothetical protein
LVVAGRVLNWKLPAVFLLLMLTTQQVMNIQRLSRQQGLQALPPVRW